MSRRNWSARDLRSLQRLVRQYGEEAIKHAIFEPVLDEELTIISNLHLHPVPVDFIRGEVFIASEGNLDFSDRDSVKKSLTEILTITKKKLQERRWKSVYILPFGHCVVSMNIKMLVYRVLHIEAKEIMHLGQQDYAHIDIFTRDL
jgi:hypothetical protein